MCNGSCGNVDKSVIGWLLATFGVFFALMLVMVVLVLIFWVWMLTDAVKREDASYAKIGSGDKSIWIIILVIAFIFQMTLVGSLIYFFLIYQKDRPNKPVVQKKK
jgi:type VI protein secretion system component VasK